MSTLKEICKEQTELLNECRQNIKELIEENEKLQENNEQLVENNDQLNEIFNYQENKKKELRKEREKLKDRLNQAYEDGYQMEGKYRDMKTQRDTLIDDIAVLRANNERLERENKKQLELLKKFSGFIHFKLWVSPTSDTYKHYRSELNKLGVK